MIIIGIVLSFVGLAYLCWLLFALAVHALPFFAGATVGLAAYHSGSGPVAAIIIGVIAGSAILVLGQVAFTNSRSPLIRAALVLLFAVPAAVAGYHAARGLAHFVVPTEAWARDNRCCLRDHRGSDGHDAHVPFFPTRRRAGRCCRSDVA